MIEELHVAGGVYQDKTGVLCCDPSLKVSAEGHISRSGEGAPSDAARWFCNAGAALIACCYIDALGKVVREGKHEGKGENFRRFSAFVHSHMQDLVAECDRRGNPFSIHTLYSTYRCGFVHQFADRDAIWGRRGRWSDYWIDSNGRPGINVGRLVAGLVSGIEDFRYRFDERVRRQEVTHADFFRWLGAVTCR
jgi:hypothetical protein